MRTSLCLQAILYSKVAMFVTKKKRKQKTKRKNTSVITLCGLNAFGRLMVTI